MSSTTNVTLPSPSAWHLLVPKWLTARARAGGGGERGHGLRLFFLAIFGLAFWSFIFTILYRLLDRLREQPEIGSLLAGKLLGMI
ncbi:MAG: hypothetical protein ACREBE_03140, partial [bacterium]